MKKLAAVLLGGAFSAVVVGILSAHAASGAIFTTVVDGSEVHFNHYASKLDVSLDGGPGRGAPQTAAGLDDSVDENDTYTLLVTNPPGKTLLLPESMIFHEAHVEAIEESVHNITLFNRPGCTMGVLS